MPIHQLGSQAPVPYAVGKDGAEFASFSHTKFWSVTQAGPQLTPGNTVIVCFRINPAISAEQVIWGVGDATTGWVLDFTALAVQVVMKNGAGVNLYTLGGTFNLVDYAIIAITRLNAGAMKSCYCGGQPALMNGGVAPVYNPTPATAQHRIGEISSTWVPAGLPATQMSWLWCAWLAEEATDTQLRQYTNQVNAQDSFTPPASILANANLQFCAQASDWDGVSATFTAGAGAARPTWTRTGAPVKNIIEGEYLYDWDQALGHWGWENRQRSPILSSIGVPYILGDSFQEARHRSRATRLRVDANYDTSQSFGVPFNSHGLLVDGVAQGDGLAVSVLEYGINRTRSWFLSAGDKELRVRSGPQSLLNTGGTPHGIQVTGLRTPKSQPLRRITPIPPASLLNLTGNSLTTGMFITSGANLSNTYQAWSMRARNNYYPNANPHVAGDVLVRAIGIWAWLNECSTAPLIAQSVARIVARMYGQGGISGIAPNRLCMTMLETNDYGLSLSSALTWPAATMRTSIVAWGQALYAAARDLEVIFCLSTQRASETTLNVYGAGNDLPGYRAAVAGAAAEINTAVGVAGYVKVIDASTALPFPADFNADGLHFNSQGNIDFETWIRNPARLNY
jgi:hypothetical protein